MTFTIIQSIGIISHSGGTAGRHCDQDLEKVVASSYGPVGKITGIKIPIDNTTKVPH